MSVAAKPLKIALAVQGRFHAFDLAQELIALGHEVRVLTNYPKFAIERFGLAGRHAETCPWHGVLIRAVGRLRVDRGERMQRWLHESFGRWAAGRLRRHRWDVSYSWSGVSQELLRLDRSTIRRRLLVRESSHIRFQHAILKQEKFRTQREQECPGSWIMDREEAEYHAADCVVVVSEFARRSFIAEGFPETRLRKMNTGVRVENFRLSAEALAARCARVQRGAALQVLMVGTFCYRKGAHDYAQIVRSLPRDRFRFKFVGHRHHETESLVRDLAGIVEFVDRVPQADLVRHYSAADLFMFPSLEEGLPAVLSQAGASALPILATPNAGSEDVIQDPRMGWVLPIRNPDAFVKTLREADVDRERLVEMARYLHTEFKPRSWANVARSFLEIVDLIQNEGSSNAHA